MGDAGGAVDEVTGLHAQFPPPSAAWQAMWAESLHNLAAVQGWYAGGKGMNVSQLRAAAAAFFVSCFHLKDHLKADPSVPPTVQSRVESYVRATYSLKLTADIANTYKHGGRDPGKPVCNLTEASITPAGAVVTFTWTDVHGNPVDEDCLKLAQEATDAWETFLQRHNLKR